MWVHQCIIMTIICSLSHTGIQRQCLNKKTQKPTFDKDTKRFGGYIWGFFGLFLSAFVFLCVPSGSVAM